MSRRACLMSLRGFLMSRELDKQDRLRVSLPSKIVLFFVRDLLQETVFFVLGS